MFDIICDVLREKGVMNKNDLFIKLNIRKVNELRQFDSDISSLIELGHVHIIENKGEIYYYGQNIKPRKWVRESWISLRNKLVKDRPEGLKRMIDKKIMELNEKIDADTGVAFLTKSKEVI